MSPPHYYPEGSAMLAELADTALSKITRACDSQTMPRNYYWLWDIVKEKLQAHGFFGDVMKADAVCMFATKPKLLFQEKTEAVDHVARNAIGLEQAPVILIIVIHCTD